MSKYFHDPSFLHVELNVAIKIAHLCTPARAHLPQKFSKSAISKYWRVATNDQLFTIFNRVVDKTNFKRFCAENSSSKNYKSHTNEPKLIENATRAWIYTTRNRPISYQYAIFHGWPFALGWKSIGRPNFDCDSFVNNVLCDKQVSPICR